jgi:hypothetical protein
VAVALITPAEALLTKPKPSRPTLAAKVTALREENLNLPITCFMLSLD